MERQGQGMSDRKSWLMFALVCVGVSMLVFAWIRSSSASEIAGWTPLNDAMERTIASNPLEEVKSNDASSIQVPNVQIENIEAASPSTTPAQNSQVTNDTSQSDTKVEPANGLIPVNTATKEQLMELPGIGESKAKAIIAYREAHGKFASIDELRNVKGIGPKVFAKLKPLVRL